MIAIDCITLDAVNLIDKHSWLKWRLDSWPPAPVPVAAEPREHGEHDPQALHWAEQPLPREFHTLATAEMDSLRSFMLEWQIGLQVKSYVEGRNRFHLEFYLERLHFWSTKTCRFKKLHLSASAQASNSAPSSPSMSMISSSAGSCLELFEWPDQRDLSNSYLSDDLTLPFQTEPELGNLLGHFLLSRLERRTLGSASEWPPAARE